jgi:hypothetical protein
MPSCSYWRTQQDGFHGDCEHPKCTVGDRQCILNTEDECVLRVPVITSIQVEADDRDRLRKFGFPLKLAIKKVLDLAESLP